MGKGIGNIAGKIGEIMGEAVALSSPDFSSQTQIKCGQHSGESTAIPS